MVNEIQSACTHRGKNTAEHTYLMLSLTLTKTGKLD